MGLILLDLHPGSLLWVAIYGLVSSLSSVLLGASVGSFIDRYATCLPLKLRIHPCMHHIIMLCLAEGRGTALYGFASTVHEGFNLLQS